MKEEIRALMNEALEGTLEQINTNILKLNARLSAQRLLMEIVFSNTFISNAGGFDALMEQLIKTTGASNARSEPMPDDYATELQALIATDLERFQNAVALRISSGLRP